MPDVGSRFFTVASLATVIVVLAGGRTGSAHHQTPVQVEVYYESLCPDSIKFFTKQLYPTLQGNLSHFVNLTLYPFGKSKYSFDVNQYEFTCHHGATECMGNKIHLCALHLIDKGHNSPDLHYNKFAVGFVNCLMDKVQRNNDSGPSFTFPTEDCALINNIPNLSDILNCATSPEGSNHLASVGKKTIDLRPPLQSVPTIVFNGKFQADDNHLANENFMQALCQHIDSSERPMDCNAGTRSYNTSVSNVVILLAAMLTLLQFMSPL